MRVFVVVVCVCVRVSLAKNTITHTKTNKNLCHQKLTSNLYFKVAQTPFRDRPQHPLTHISPGNLCLYSSDFVMHKRISQAVTQQRSDGKPTTFSSLTGSASRFVPLRTRGSGSSTCAARVSWWKGNSSSNTIPTKPFAKDFATTKTTFTSVVVAKWNGSTGRNRVPFSTFSTAAITHLQGSSKAPTSRP